MWEREEQQGMYERDIRVRKRNTTAISSERWDRNKDSFMNAEY